MSRKIITSIRNSITHFKRPLKQGEYKVVPPPLVPDDIVKPAYVTQSNPTFGIYEGSPVIHSPQAIRKLRKSAYIASNTLKEAQQMLINNTQDITLQDIDRFVFNSIIKQGAYPTPIGFMGFPKSVCISLNECIVHGIPSLRPVDKGDKINMDVTVYYDGYHGDTNLSLIYGGVDSAPTQSVKNIISLTQQALYEAISICKPGVKFNKIGKTIEEFAKKNGIHICPDFTGHGVGHLLHMPPMVLHTYYETYNPVMSVGNVFTIEPILTQKPANNLKMWGDEMTITSENNPNAQFEHMILIVEDGCEVLTQRKGEKIPNPNGNIKNLRD